MTKALPEISVCIGSYHKTLHLLGNCLRNIRDQDYPQEKIEIVVGYGGEQNEIENLAQQTGSRFIIVPKNKQSAEYNRGVAFNEAKKTFVLIFDDDNYMPEKDYLKKLTKPFEEDNSVVAVETCYYHYDKNYSLFDRYYALFGTLDPIPYYLNKADRMRQDQNKWSLVGQAEDTGNYYIVRFDSDPRKIPTIGSNGCLMRRELVLDNADTSPENFFHTDVLVDVIKAGHDRFAFTKNSTIHLTGEQGIINFMLKRYRYMRQFSLRDSSRRRYRVFMRGDEFGLLLFIMYSATFIKPTYDALRGYLKIRDRAWFLHPIICFAVLILYVAATIQGTAQKIIVK